MKILFGKDKWLFELTVPEYETANFGGKMGELRLVSKLPEEFIQYNIDPIDDIYFTLLHDEILACTFRGKEEINIIRCLNELGFMFVATYNTVSCVVSEFKEIETGHQWDLSIAKESEFDDLLKIELSVFDYSTFQIDPVFPNEITSKRNVMRVKHHFDNPKHCAYIIKVKEKIIGFLQFLIDEEQRSADLVNVAIVPSMQGVGIGKILFSNTFRDIFSSGINQITAGYCVQNIVMGVMLKVFNFKIIDHEIHLRLHV